MVPAVVFSVLFNVPKFFEVTFVSKIRVETSFSHATDNDTATVLLVSIVMKVKVAIFMNRPGALISKGGVHVSLPNLLEPLRSFTKVHSSRYITLLIVNDRDIALKQSSTHMIDNAKMFCRT